MLCHSGEGEMGVSRSAGPSEQIMMSLVYRSCGEKAAIFARSEAPNFKFCDEGDEFASRQRLHKILRM